MSDRITFSFGKNWDEFVRTALNQERIDIARRCLLEYLKLTDLKGKSFLDIGSGSGLSSLAAFDAGAERVTSLDVDPASIATTRRVRSLRGNPENWIVLEARYVLRDLIIPALRLQVNPFERVRNYRLKRGMSYFTDVKDWLGGYPYEHARIEQILFFCRDEFGYQLENLRTGAACTEYAFRRSVDTSTNLATPASPAAFDRHMTRKAG